MTLPAALAELAAAQGGPFTRAQVRGLGLTSHAVRRLLDDCVPLRHGVHVERSVRDAARDDPRAMHLLEGAAKVLVCRGSALARRSAAVAYDLPLLGRLPARPELTRHGRRLDDTSSVPGLRVAPLTPDEVETVHGVRCTSLCRTVADVLRTSVLREAVVVGDAALGRALDLAALRTAVAAASAWPGGVAAGAALGLLDGRAETPLESLTRLAYVQQGVPAPETQVEVRGPGGRLLGVVDFLWRAQRVVGEADGLLKYTGLQDLQAEKLREEGMRRAGFDVVRNLWDDVWTQRGQRALAQRWHEAVAHSAGRPPVTGVRLTVPTLEELRRRRAARSAA